MNQNPEFMRFEFSQGFRTPTKGIPPVWRIEVALKSTDSKQQWRTSIGRHGRHQTSFKQVNEQKQKVLLIVMAACWNAHFSGKGFFFLSDGQPAHTGISVRARKVICLNPWKATARVKIHLSV